MEFFLISHTHTLIQKDRPIRYGVSHPSKKTITASTSGGPFAKRPREMLVWILEFFTIYEVAQLQRFVCREFRDAGQERIHERGGRTLYEEGMVYFYGLEYKRQLTKIEDVY